MTGAQLTLDDAPRRIGRKKLSAEVMRTEDLAIAISRGTHQAQFNFSESLMLVLTRKLRESLRTGDRIVVTVLKIQGNKVRIGIDAPKEVEVIREELRDRMTERPDGFVPDAA